MNEPEDQNKFIDQQPGSSFLEFNLEFLQQILSSRDHKKLYPQVS